MSDIQKSERFLFGIPSSLYYVLQSYPDGKAGTLNQLRAAGVAMDAVDKCNTTGYFYPIPICQGVKKRRGRPEGKPHRLVDIGCANNLCFPYATTEPDLTWNIMDVIKSYRRFSPRRLFYILCATLPAKSSQPVISFGRDPPTD